jgi:hypothetical protein
MDRSRRATLFLYAIFTSVLLGCAGLSSVPITPEALKNAQYKSEWLVLGQAKLTNGIYKEKFAPDSSTEIVLILSDKMVIGDLNGDGVEDAVVVLITQPGGSGTFYDLVLVFNRGGKLVQVDSLPLGDRIKVKSMVLESGEVKLEITVHGPKDPMCCPTRDVTLHYRVKGDRLTRTQ